MNILAYKLRLFSEFSQKIAAFSFKKTIKEAVNLATELLEAEIASLLLFDEKTKTLKIAYAKGLPYRIVKRTSLKVGERISGYVFKTREPLFIKDIDKEEKFEKVGSERYFTASLISCPLKIDRKVIGVININNKRNRRPFNKLDLEILAGISSQIAQSIDRAKKFEKLQNTYRQTLNSLINAIDARDHYTRLHSERVAFYGEKFAKELNLSKRNIEVIKEACFLHDIGKIGIPDVILNKNEKLSTEEFEVMKQHSIIGYNILKPLEFLGKIPEIVKANHERWDGRGYPDGLKGEKIPLGARILCICDAFVTMIDKRGYKRAFTYKEAFRELRRNKGKQFDPTLVGIFLKIFEK